MNISFGAVDGVPAIALLIKCTFSFRHFLLPILQFDKMHGGFPLDPIKHCAFRQTEEKLIIAMKTNVEGIELKPKAENFRIFLKINVVYINFVFNC
ncbi:MAG: hypothetical protein IPL25_16765 [Saprospiraceae bacterium]|nr:hypothetical protein [Candidatus Vicinibacter affinis]